MYTIRLSGKQLPFPKYVNVQTGASMYDYILLEAPGSTMEYFSQKHIIDKVRRKLELNQPGDKLYAALANEQNLAYSSANPHRNRRNNSNENPPLSIAALGMHEKGREAIALTDQLLRRIGSSRADPKWHVGGEQYIDFERRSAQRVLHILQSKIVHCITEREAELSVLQRRTGLAESQKFLTALNGRWKALEQLVKNYNKEVVKFNRTSPNRTLRLLDAAVLKSRGLDSDEIWEIDLLMSRSDWAVYDFVRQGIEAVCRLQRVAEERSLLRLHCTRMVGWLSRQLEILLPEAELRHERLTRCMVLHRYKVIVSLLAMKSPVASDQDRDVLWDLRRRIETLLQPESIPVEDAAVPQDHAGGGRPSPPPAPHSPSPVRGESPSECESDYSEEDPVEHLEQEAMDGVLECMERYEREEDASPMGDQLDDELEDLNAFAMGDGLGGDLEMADA